MKNKKQFVILDTETTGLDHDAEIVEICILRNDGLVLLDTLVKPLNPIPAQATAIHGITNKDVENAPYYHEIHNQVIDILNQYTCYIYNSDYDTRLIKQSCEQYNIGFNREEYKFKWVMLDYAKQYNFGKWAKLIHAYDRLAFNKPSGIVAHRALGDCIMTLCVIEQMY